MLCKTVRVAARSAPYQQHLSQPQPLPARPFQRVTCDLFQWNGQDYLLLIDYFSRFIELDQLRSTTSSAVVAALSAHFARYGIPEEFVLDNGPQFSSHAFAVFMAHHGITHRTSSPHNAQSNGVAERAIRTIKTMLMKSESCHDVLLAYRSTPLQCGFSPAQLLMGRRIRASVPATPEQLELAWPDLTLFRQQQSTVKEQQTSTLITLFSTRKLWNLVTVSGLLILPGRGR